MSWARTIAPSRGAAAFLFCILAVSCRVSFAQANAVPAAPAPAQGPTLTLKDAVQLALKQNPQILIARLLSLESDRNRQIARSALLPQASLDASGQIVQYNVQSIEKSDKRAETGPFQYIQAGPSFSQSMLNLPLIRKYQAAREDVRQTLAQETVTHEDVISSAVTQYLNVLRAFALYDAAKSRVALAQRLYDQAVNLQKTGIGLTIDTTRANVELQNERQNLIDAETATHTTIYVLAELLDLPRDQEPVVADRLQFFDLPAVVRTEAIASALADRPEVKAQASQERIAYLNRESASEQRLPEIDFGGFWDYQGEHFNNGIPAYLYQVSFSIPLFTGGRIQAQVGEADLERKRIAENRQVLEAEIVQQVKSAIDEMDAARQAVDVANLGLQLANDEVAQAQRRFAAGVTTNVEVITAQDELARANDNQIDALYRFNESRVNLAQAMGEVENTYAK
jgi:outer membrane protein